MEYTGKLIKGVGGLYEVRLENGETICCKAKGAFRHESVTPCVGDDVTVRDEEGCLLQEIAPRRNVLIRPPIANVDVLFIVFAAVEPEPVPLNVDKLTCIAVHAGIRPVITVTKADKAPEKAESLAAIYRDAGFPVFITGGDPAAVPTIRDYLHTACRGATVCFAGASGVGKSTLISALFPSLSLKTGAVSARIGRGRHTTRHVELYPFDRLFCDGTAGYLADTPGFSLLDFVRFDFLDKEALPGTFPEFAPFLGSCRYTRCTHLCEEGCAVCEAVRRGEIGVSRHESYISIYRDLMNKHKWDK